MTEYRLRATATHREMIVKESDVEWTEVDHDFYKILMTLHHIPSGEKITQAAGASKTEAKRYCLRELQHRLYKIPPKERRCEYCGILIKIKGKFCGAPCRQVAQKMSMMGNKRAGHKEQVQA